MIANFGRSAGLDIPMDAGLTDADVEGMLIIREDNAEYIANAISRGLAKALDRIGAAMQSHAQQLCPVDTGRLRNSITYKLGGGGFGFPGHGASLGSGDNTITVGTDVEYAAYVELGTSRMAARPYLLPAATEYADEYRRIVEGEIGLD